MDREQWRIYAANCLYLGRSLRNPVGCDYPGGDICHRECDCPKLKREREKKQSKEVPRG